MTKPKNEARRALRHSSFVIRPFTQGCSSIGRALVSKTSGWEFDPPRPCHHKVGAAGLEWRLNCHSSKSRHSDK
jgi:hypothetical protein